MKYLNSYDSYNEAKNAISPVVNIITNLLSTLGLKCRSGQTSTGTPAVHTKSLDSYTKYFEIELNLGKIKNSIISNIINSMLDTNNCEYDVIPSFEGFNNNFAADKEFTILINPDDKFSETFLTKIISTKSD